MMMCAGIKDVTCASQCCPASACTAQPRFIMKTRTRFIKRHGSGVKTSVGLRVPLPAVPPPPVPPPPAPPAPPPAPAACGQLRAPSCKWSSSREDEESQKKRLRNHKSVPLRAKAHGAPKFATLEAQKTALPPPPPAPTRSPVRVLTVQNPPGSAKLRKRALVGFAAPSDIPANINLSPRGWQSWESWGAKEFKSTEEFKHFKALPWRSEDKQCAHETEGLLPAAFGGPLAAKPISALRARSPERPAPPRGLLQPFAPPAVEGAVSAACPCDKSSKGEDDVDEVPPAWLMEYLHEECHDDKTYTPSQWMEWFKDKGIKSFWRYVPYDEKNIQGRREPKRTAEIVTDEPDFDLEPGTLVPVAEERTIEGITYIRAADPKTVVWYFDRRPTTDLHTGGQLFQKAYGSE